MDQKPATPVTRIKLSIAMMVVASTQIHAIGHDQATNTLAIEFKKKDGPGNLYYYKPVPRGVYDKFVVAESKGRFFGEFIKGNPEYPPTKYVPEEEREPAV